MWISWKLWRNLGKYYIARKRPLRDLNSRNELWMTPKAKSLEPWKAYGLPSSFTQFSNTKIVHDWYLKILIIKGWVNSTVIHASQQAQGLLSLLIYLLSYLLVLFLNLKIDRIWILGRWPHDSSLWTPSDSPLRIALVLGVVVHTFGFRSLPEICCSSDALWPHPGQVVPSIPFWSSKMGRDHAFLNRCQKIWKGMGHCTIWWCFSSGCGFNIKLWQSVVTLQEN